MKRSVFRIEPAKAVICFLCIPLFFACSKDDEYYEVKTDKETIIFTNESNSQMFNITSEGEWHLEAEGLKPYIGAPIGRAEWYEVDKMYGNGNTTVTITLNEVHPENRTATLTVVGNHNKVNLSLKQQIPSD
jgi:hypothetical protein